MTLANRFSVAPMIDWTDRHCRYFHRLFTKHALLYTEMITTGALLHGDAERHLRFNSEEHPVALQLGGSNPTELALCAKMGEEAGYDEINLNVGCPSDRVQQGRFGACLMAEPELVAECISEMQARTKIPVTVKTRIGIDESIEQDFLWRFVEIVKQAGCHTFIIHARKAWLKGLSPKENREIPPLRYELVYQLKQAFPDLFIAINGGIQNLDEAKTQMNFVDGVMLGRAAYHNPYLLTQVDELFFDDVSPTKSREEILNKLIPYFEKNLAEGVALHSMLRHILGLWHGEPGARKIRQQLSDPHASADEKMLYLGLIKNFANAL